MIELAHTLIQQALDVRLNAYVPYSKFQVGAVVLSDTQKTYRGVNIENASYGLTCCAERNAIFSAVTDGLKYIKIMAVVADTESPVSMCGACRQVAVEFMNQDSVIICSNVKNPTEYKTWTAQQLLPFFFNSDDLK